MESTLLWQGCFCAILRTKRRFSPGKGWKRVRLLFACLVVGKCRGVCVRASVCMYVRAWMGSGHTPEWDQGTHRNGIRAHTMVRRALVRIQLAYDEVVFAR